MRSNSLLLQFLFRRQRSLAVKEIRNWERKSAVLKKNLLLEKIIKRVKKLRVFWQNYCSSSKNKIMRHKKMVPQAILKVYKKAEKKIFLLRYNSRTKEISEIVLKKWRFSIITSPILITTISSKNSKRSFMKNHLNILGYIAFKIGQSLKIKTS